MEDSATSHAITPGDLKAALAGGELSLAYQPKIDLPSGELVGVEALSRWKHPKYGAVPPVAFIALAESTGLIGALTDWLLPTALSQWRKWHEGGLDINLAVNVSAKSLEQMDFPDAVHGFCRDHGVPSEYLSIELTESAAQGVVALMDTLTRFRIKGMGVSLDDFGIGYSSLSRLQQLPFTEMKIDKSFVMLADRALDCRVIVRSIVDLAHNLGLEVTAEGVESKDVLTLLVDLGCDTAQGYFIAEPMAGEALADWAKAWRAKVKSGEVGLGPNAVARVRTAERLDVVRRQRGHRARY